MGNDMNININIMIPVLNEEKSLLEKIYILTDYLNSTELKEKYRITIIDNGSNDKTPQLCMRLSERLEGIVYFIRLEHRGVGLALRAGIKNNPFDIVGYMDLDLATDIRHLRQVYREFADKGQNIVVGSRLLKGSRVIGRSGFRNFTSKSLNMILKFYLKVNFTDAMCGFKFYKKDIAEKLLQECSSNNGWFYCAEMLIRSEWLGIAIKEIPVRWTDDPDSKVKAGNLILSYLKEIGKLHKERRYKL